MKPLSLRSKYEGECIPRAWVSVGFLRNGAPPSVGVGDPDPRFYRPFSHILNAAIHPRMRHVQENPIRGGFLRLILPWRRRFQWRSLYSDQNVDGWCRPEILIAFRRTAAGTPGACWANWSCARWIAVDEREGGSGAPLLSRRTA